MNPTKDQIIDFVKEFYKEYKTTPPMRVLVKSLNTTSIHIHTLFPDGAKQIAKQAGLPKPTRCT